MIPAASSWVLPFRSGYVNAAAFIVVDLTALWAIHRGLMAIQGVMIFHALRAGRAVRLKRSSVPLLSGELLVRHRRGPNWLVLAHTVFLGLAFVGSLGINGESGMRTVQVPRMYETYLMRNRTNGGMNGTHPHTQRAFLRCRRTYGGTVNYHSSAFNMTGDVVLRDDSSFRDFVGRRRAVNVNSVVCQDDILFSVHNCTGCFASVDSVSTRFRLATRKDEQSSPTSSSNITTLPAPEQSEMVKELKSFRGVVNWTEDEAGSIAVIGDKVVCVQVQPAGPVSCPYPDSPVQFRCFLIRIVEDDEFVRVWYGLTTVRPCEIESSTETLELNVVSGSASVQKLDNDTMNSIFVLGLQMTGPLLGHSLLDIMDSSVLLLTGAKELGKAEMGLPFEITVIPLYSWFCMLLLVVFALFLGIMREGFEFTYRRTGRYAPAVLNINRYDTVSSILRNTNVSVDSEHDSRLGAVLSTNGRVDREFTAVEFPESWFASEITNEDENK